ncbi:MAG: universal stress protein E [Phenylobacterium sp.]|jgi:universal stress protein E
MRPRLYPVLTQSDLSVEKKDMNSLNNILVVIDPNDEAQNALARAVVLAKASGASVTAFLSIYDFSYEMTTMLSIAERDAMRKAVVEDRELWIKDIISENFSDGIDIFVNVLWHNRPFEAIIETVIKQDYDLVVKGTHTHDTLKSIIFTPTDWHLLRKCPCPVLLVKEMEWAKDGRILAAVHTGSDAGHHKALNDKIIQESFYLANLVSAQVHMVNSFPGTPVNIAIEIPEFDPTEYNTVVKQHHEEAMNELANQYDISKDRIHIDEGLPEDVIPEVSSAIDAELLVIGTIGRTGFSAAIIGNTAEHVLDRINSDVLAIKPDGYVSPLAEV